jgi:WD40 repeat protein
LILADQGKPYKKLLPLQHEKVDAVKKVNIKDKTSSSLNRVQLTDMLGIISSLAFSPDYSGLLAAGTYNRNIGLYDSASGELCSVFGGQDGGVTQVGILTQ